MGSREGGLKTAATIKAKYGEDFYRNLGRSGGSSKKYTKDKRPFYQDRSLAARAGYAGGKARGRANKEASDQA